jgi:5,6,7,8-tetrahydromethanopterin hydro-lyase
VADGVIPSDAVDDLALIAAVWVNPRAKDVDLVYRNNREAVRTALAAGAARRPGLDEVLAARARPHNPFYPVD